MGSLHQPGYERGARYRRVIRGPCKLELIVTAVIHPCERNSLEGAVEAQREALVAPSLQGPWRWCARAGWTP